MQYKLDSEAPTQAVPPCSPDELKRLKVAQRIVWALSAIILTIAITFGYAPRSFVGRMNMFLIPLAVIALAVCGHSL